MYGKWYANRKNPMERMKKQNIGQHIINVYNNNSIYQFMHMQIAITYAPQVHTKLELQRNIWEKPKNYLPRIISPNMKNGGFLYFKTAPEF